MVKLLVAKILCMVGVFFSTLLGSLLPVKIIKTDLEKAHRSEKILSLCNTLEAGCFWLHASVLYCPLWRTRSLSAHAPSAPAPESAEARARHTDSPLAETIVMLGFFMTVFLERLILTFRKEKPSFLGLETFNASSDPGSNSAHESPFMGGAQGHALYAEPHAHGLSVQGLSRSRPPRLLGLAFALSVHSIFEGLQEEGEKVVSLWGWPSPGHWWLWPWASACQELRAPEGRGQGGRHRERHSPCGHRHRPGH